MKLKTNSHYLTYCRKDNSFGKEGELIHFIKVTTCFNKTSDVQEFKATPIMAKNANLSSWHTSTDTMFRLLNFVEITEETNPEYFL